MRKKKKKDRAIRHFARSLQKCKRPKRNPHQKKRDVIIYVK